MFEDVYMVQVLIKDVYFQKLAPEKGGQHQSTLPTSVYSMLNETYNIFLLRFIFLQLYRQILA